MPQAAYSTVTEDGEARADRSNSDGFASATARAQYVDGAVHRVSMGDATDPHANAASWQVLTGGEQNVRPVPIRFTHTPTRGRLCT